MARPSTVAQVSAVAVAGALASFEQPATVTASASTVAGKTRRRSIERDVAR